MVFRVFVFALFALTLSGCESIADRVGFALRTKIHSNAFTALDPAVQDRLRHGIVARGDTQEMVLIALGSPDWKTKAKTSEEWTYLYYSLGAPERGRNGLHQAESRVDRRVTFGLDAGNRFVVVEY